MTVYFIYVIIITGTDVGSDAVLFWTMMLELKDEEQDFILAIYQKYGKYMYKTAYDVLQNRQDAEDAVGETMCKMIKYIAKFEGAVEEEIQNQVVIGIRSTVRRKAIDLYNKRKKRNENETSLYYIDRDEQNTAACSLEDHSSNLEDLVIAKDTLAQVRDIILGMPKEMQDTINLVWLNGYTSAEAAEFLGVSDSVVRGRIYRIRKKIREALGGGADEQNRE